MNHKPLLEKRGWGGRDLLAHLNLDVTAVVTKGLWTKLHSQITKKLSFLAALFLSFFMNNKDVGGQTSADVIIFVSLVILTTCWITA